MHQRMLIRHAVVARLTGTTAAGVRVKATRVEPQKGASLPTLAIYTPSEETDRDDASSAPRELWRHLVVKIAGWVVDTASIPADDAMDNLAEQIEAAMAADRYFGGAVVDSILTTTDTAIVDDGDPLIGFIQLTYDIEYRTDADSIGILVDYLRTQATYQITGAGADNTVSDQFNQRPAP